jgi:hypothetical protein
MVTRKGIKINFFSKKAYAVPMMTGTIEPARNGALRALM